MKIGQSLWMLLIAAGAVLDGVHGEAVIVAIKFDNPDFSQETGYSFTNAATNEVVWNKPPGSFSESVPSIQETVDLPTGIVYSFALIDTSDGLSSGNGNDGDYNVTSGVTGNVITSGGGFFESNQTTLFLVPEASYKPVTLKINYDRFSADVTYSIQNAATNEIVYSVLYSPANNVISTERTIYLPGGDYTLTIKDSGKDGLSSNGVAGDYALTLGADGNGEILANGVGNFGSQVSKNFFLPAEGITSAPVPTSAPIAPDPNKNGICFLLYQMADNNLESSIRGDLKELIGSAAVRATDFTTWVYFDSLNYDTKGVDVENIRQPLPDVYTADGTQTLLEANGATGKHQGSQYLKFDSSLGKMVQERVIPDEINSDMMTTIQNFAVTGLTDCVAKGAAEFMFVFSSHGGGITGFGGDENKGGRRRLAQPNQSVVAGLQNALNAVPGAPTKFDVLGFDACLMQAFGAIDEYKSITKFYLASEATEPGHGWAYDMMSDTASALDLAVEVVDNYVDTLHGGDSHQTPKTLAVVDTSEVDGFVAKWETLCAELNRLQKVDANLNAHIHRARAEAVAYKGSGDNSGQTPDEKASVDIGSFLKTFQTHCRPAVGSVLETAILEAMTAHSDMFITRRTGQGTATGTGMAILWPLRAKYNTDFFTFLFGNINYATASAPNFQTFLKELLTGTTPTTVGNACEVSVQSSKIPTNPGQLLLEPSVSVSSGNRRLASQVTAETEVVLSTDYVQIVYGINFDESSNRMRRLRQVAQTNGESALDLSMDDTWRGPAYNAKNRRLSRPRRTQEDDFLILFGGDVLGTYSGPTYSATWDRRFYLIENTATGALEDVYVFDDGQGAKTIPVLYFPPTTSAASLAALPDTIAEARAQLNAKNAFLSFSVGTDGVPLNNLILFSESGLDNQTYSETPTSAGGFIAPIVYVEAVFDGKAVDVLVGGFNSTVLPWTVENTIKMTTITDQEYSELFDVIDDPVGPVLIDVSAFDFDIYDEDSDTEDGVEFRTLNVPLAPILPPSPAPAGVGLPFTYELPNWWDAVQNVNGSDNLKRCFKRQFPPTQGDACATRIKICYFGDQICAAPINGPFPTTKCTCNGSKNAPGTWNCEAEVCPTV